MGALEWPCSKVGDKAAALQGNHPIEEWPFPVNLGPDRSNSWGGGTTRAEDTLGTPTQSHIPPSILVNEESTPTHTAHYQGTSLNTTKVNVP